MDQTNLEAKSDMALPVEAGRASRPEGLVTSFHTIDSWRIGDAQKVHNRLEVINWSWPLATPAETLETIAHTFPKGQLLVRDRQGEPLASLVTNRINWDGMTSSLPTWDQVVGLKETGNSVSDGDCTQTYTPDGNTLVLLSMNGNPGEHGLARELIGKIKEIARELGVDHLVGPFRPSGYGEFKMTILERMMANPGGLDIEAYERAINFENYCKMTTIKDGNVLPQDPWLRSVTRNGMKPLITQADSMKVVVSHDEFLAKKNESEKSGNKWVEITKGVWEYGEVGRFYEYSDHAEYREANYWGEFPLT